MKEQGLGEKDDWQNGNGQTLSGLGRIENDLSEEIKKLPQQTEIIRKAAIRIYAEIANVKIDMDNVFNPFDVMDHLRRLGKKIGTSKDGYSDSLQAIQNMISDLQSGDFTNKPQAIGDAKQEIVDELGNLRTTLEGTQGQDVIETLNDLQNNGLSENSWHPNGKNEEGLKSIENELQHQQSELSGQPKNIRGGVQDITRELQRLQKQLNEQVTEKLTKLKSDGLGNVASWDIDDNSAKGLTQITTEIVAIKTRDVRDKLKELCRAIRTEANELSRDLKRLKGDSLDELTGIKDQLHNLQIRLVSGPIQACKEFIDREADKFGRECIAFLHAFVDGQVATAIDDITAFAKQQCAANIKELLKLFAQKVGEELRELPWEIDSDLRLEYKGLMARVEDGLENTLNVKKLKESKSLPPLSSAFMRFYSSLEDHVDREINRFHDEEQRKKNPKRQDAQEYSTRLSVANEALHTVLTYIKDNDTFDHRLRALLRKLTEALSHLRPESFAKPSTPVLDGLVEGLTKFADEFTCAYVSAYAGQTFTDEEGEKCAKVFLTMLPTLCDALHRLAEQCKTGGSWRDLHINSSSQLGTFLQRCGYRVSTSPSDQDGELRDDCNGRDVFVLVTQNIRNTEDNEHLKKCLSLTHACNLLQLLKCLCTHLHQYYQTCHLKVHPSPRPPCSIYEMLTWCCGLTYNAVYLGLNSEALPSLFEADEQGSADSDVSLTDLGSLALPAHPQHISLPSPTHSRTSATRRIQCSPRYSATATQVAYTPATSTPTRQACSTPATPTLCSACCTMCSNASTNSCISSTAGASTTPGTADGSTAGTAGASEAHRGGATPCSVPTKYVTNSATKHTTKYVTNAVTNTLSAALSRRSSRSSRTAWLASRASTGRHIMDVLGAFCGGASSPLTRLCDFLNCLFTRPPRTPDDLFAFYYNFLRDWTQNVDHRKAAFEGAVGDACFWQRGVTLDVSTIFRTKDHGSVTNMPHLTGDLFSLVECNGTPLSPASHPCGPYLKPLGHDVRATFSKAHAHLYLSWIVYLTETFYNYLKELLQDCERNCAYATSTCHARSCANDCTARRRPLAPNSRHHDSCPSIVDCDSTTPTLFKYGFVHRDAHSLAGSTRGPQSKRTCEDLCTALQVVVKEMNPLHRLAHDTIPEYLYRIRAPFLYTITALWSIATLYIAHTMLYRMDVLRIRSHLLTTRASHLIDVKALLAGSRRMLSLYKDVDYFDDDFHS
ncbi:Extracellular matrix-binding ebh, putative [Babesia ovata]|uniref:Extracellular matrix-binding ebh, putative n=1 Tax=Babesia ovata TaxID=189622 RepID=A0A2H6KIH9_9APIC|nr:Extracellular matrix-binding ebh, putative [Babesia ovata]GBE62804.1 Extracellular matrix-binding ebh, putative [Babesia ovata]